MKFIVPEVEIKKFDVNDILTSSRAEEMMPEETISAFDTLMEGTCVGNSSDNLVDACL